MALGDFLNICERFASMGPDPIAQLLDVALAGEPIADQNVNAMRYASEWLRDASKWAWDQRYMDLSMDLHELEIQIDSALD